MAHSIGVWDNNRSRGTLVFKETKISWRGANNLSLWNAPSVEPSENLEIPVALGKVEDRCTADPKPMSTVPKLGGL